MQSAIVEFHDYVLYDVLGGISGITSKRMFGGYGLYKEGVIFGIITSDSQIYFKVDESIKHYFVEAGSEPFVFRGYKKRPPLVMPYWLVPEEVLEDSEKVVEWVTRSAAI